MNERTDRTRFVIVGLQRSGTTVTHVVLNGHPHANMMPSEILGPFYEQGIGAFTGGKDSFATRKATYLPFFDAMASVFATEAARAIGFKAAVGNHAQAVDLAQCLREYLPGVRMILVRRDDLVAQLGSLLRAEKSGVWHAWEGVTASDAGQLKIDPMQFRNYALDCKRALAELRSLATTHDILELGYEDEIMPGTSYARAFAFLGLDELPVTWLRMQKLNPAPEEFICNYADLRAVLDSLPNVEEQEVHELREARLLEKSRGESSSFLIHRALDRLWRDLPDEANDDIRTALDKAEFPEPSAAGRAFALLERAAPNARRPERVSATLKELDRVGGDNAYFRCARGLLRLNFGLYESARDDLAAALMGEPVLDATTTKEALAGLEQAWLALADVKKPCMTLEQLAARHGENATFLCLQGGYLCMVGEREAGLERIRKAAALDPEHPRPGELLKTWASS